MMAKILALFKSYESKPALTRALQDMLRCYRYHSIILALLLEEANLPELGEFNVSAITFLYHFCKGHGQNAGLVQGCFRGLFRKRQQTPFWGLLLIELMLGHPVCGLAEDLDLVFGSGDLANLVHLVGSVQANHPLRLAGEPSFNAIQVRIYRKLLAQGWVCEEAPALTQQLLYLLSEGNPQLRAELKNRFDMETCVRRFEQGTYQAKLQELTKLESIWLQDKKLPITRLAELFISDLRQFGANVLGLLDPGSVGRLMEEVQESPYIEKEYVCETIEHEGLVTQNYNYRVGRVVNFREARLDEVKLVLVGERAEADRLPFNKADAQQYWQYLQSDLFLNVRKGLLPFLLRALDGRIMKLTPGQESALFRILESMKQYLQGVSACLNVSALQLTLIRVTLCLPF
jgi:hypothetical protein